MEGLLINGGRGGGFWPCCKLCWLFKVHDSVCDTIIYLLIMKSLEYGWTNNLHSPTRAQIHAEKSMHWFINQSIYLSIIQYIYVSVCIFCVYLYILYVLYIYIYILYILIYPYIFICRDEYITLLHYLSRATVGYICIFYKSSWKISKIRTVPKLWIFNTFI